jgi:hypothetical protein
MTEPPSDVGIPAGERDSSAARRQRGRPGWVFQALVVAVFCAGCGESDAVRVRLQSRPHPSGALTRLQLQAQVAGAQAGLRYKWFSVVGSCDPQESESPATLFQFGENMVRDRVSVEVWRGNRRVGEAELDVELDEEQARLAKEPPSSMRIEITTVPPYEKGGPDTRAGIAGRVIGEAGPELKVVVYAWAYNAWHIQPMVNAVHDIRPDNTWTTWTHTGTSYAALLVRPEFDAYVRLDTLPQAGGYVVARTLVEGARE